MTTVLSSARRKRTTKRKVIKNVLFASIDGILSCKFSEQARAEAAAMLETLTETNGEIKELDNKIEDLITDDDELETDAN